MFQNDVAVSSKGNKRQRRNFRSKTDHIADAIITPPLLQLIKDNSSDRSPQLNLSKISVNGRSLNHHFKANNFTKEEKINLSHDNSSQFPKSLQPQRNFEPAVHLVRQYVCRQLSKNKRNASYFAERPKQNSASNQRHNSKSFSSLDGQCSSLPSQKLWRFRKAFRDKHRDKMLNKLGQRDMKIGEYTMQSTMKITNEIYPYSNINPLKMDEIIGRLVSQQKTLTPFAIESKLKERGCSQQTKNFRNNILIKKQRNVSQFSIEQSIEPWEVE